MGGDVTGREREIVLFLTRAGWADASRQAIAGDASSRRYERLVRGRETAILLDAPPPAGGEGTLRFVGVGHWLRTQGYSAPAVLCDAAGQGLLLLEDLGDDVFARLLADGKAQENSLYSCVTDFLLDLHQRRVPEFARRATAAELSSLLDLAGQWFLPSVGAEAGAIRPVKDAFVALYNQLDDLPPVLSLRDFHAENLIWLPGRPGIARCGLLDFQDAFAAHPAYDLVSLLQDARRDVSAATAAMVLARYTAARGLGREGFAPMFALIGAQRALRILGVFARLSRAMDKQRYLDFVPRVWSNLQVNLDHPDLGPLTAAVRDAVPRLAEKELTRMRSAWLIQTP